MDETCYHRLIDLSRCILRRNSLVATPVKHLAVLATNPSLARVPDQTKPSGGRLERFLHASSESKRARPQHLVALKLHVPLLPRVAYEERV